MKKDIGIGIDVGGTFTKIVAVSRAGKVLAQDRVPTERDRGPRALVREAAEAVRALEKGLGRKGAVCLAAAGDVDPERGALRRAPNLSAFEGFPLRKTMGEALGRPVRMHNDANMAAWGCYVLELGRRCPNVIAVTMGTGIGGGVVLGGKLHEGATGTAGEVGHMRVAGGGFPCHCGARGCLEAHAGSYGVLRNLREVLRERPKAKTVLRDRLRGWLDPKDVAEAARRGDAVAREAWRRVGRALGVGLVNLVYLFNPDAVVLTGGVSRAGRVFLDSTRRVLAAESFRAPFRHVRIRIARSSGIGSLGAALYAFEDDAC